MTRHAITQLLNMQSGDKAGQFQPILQVIEMAWMGQESGQGRLMIVLSDGDLFVSALISQTSEQELQGVQNNSLVQVLIWRLVESSGQVVLVVSAIKYVAPYSWVIGQPNAAQPR